MIRIDSIDEGIPLYYALASEVRMKIIALLAKNKSMNMNELSNQLGIPGSTLTTHIRQLDLSGLVEVTASEGVRGIQKLCTLKENRLIIELTDKPRKRNLMRFDIPVGSYSGYAALAPCGIATQQSIIGEQDKSCYFDAPERYLSGVVWVSNGYVEYPIPNYLDKDVLISEIQISMEIASDIPQHLVSDEPCEMNFLINQISIGGWVIPKDTECTKSIYTPQWWPENWMQSGKIKLLSINGKGTFIGGTSKISDVTIERLGIEGGSRILFRIASSVGGFTIFGRGFGRYNQDIYVRITYAPKTTNGNKN